jgi:hypothetical protein
MRPLSGDGGGCGSIVGTAIRRHVIPRINAAQDEQEEFIALARRGMQPMNAEDEYQ